MKILPTKVEELPVVTAIPGSIYFCELSAYTKYEEELTSQQYKLDEDLRGKIIRNFYLDKIISLAGNFGVIIRGIDVFTGKTYAVKILIPTESTIKDFRDEKEGFEILSKYPDCAKNVECMIYAAVYRGDKQRGRKFSKNFKDSFNKNVLTKGKRMVRAKGKYLYFVFEMMDMDLFEFIYIMDSTYDLDWSMKYPQIVQKLVLDISSGIKTLHDNGIAHMDLKTENTLIKFTGKAKNCSFFRNPHYEEIQVKIGDLGLVCAKNNKYKYIEDCVAFIGTSAYSPPEITKYKGKYPYKFKYAEKADIWTLGMVFGDIMFGIAQMNEWLKEPMEDFDETLIEEDYKEFYKEFIVQSPLYSSNNKKFDKVINELFYQMVSYDPENRPTINQVLKKLKKVKF